MHTLRMERKALMCMISRPPIGDYEYLLPREHLLPGLSFAAFIATLVISCIRFALPVAQPGLPLGRVE